MLFVVKDCVNEIKVKRINEKHNGAFDDYSHYYNEECRMDVVRELQETISTPEQLDEFLNVLMSSVHLYYNSIGISNEQFRGWDGHTFTKIIVEPIIIPAFIDGRNLDLVYTSAKYLFFSNAVMSFAEQTYEDNIDDPKSIKFKEYMESIGEGRRFK